MCGGQCVQVTMTCEVIFVLRFWCRNIHRTVGNQCQCNDLKMSTYAKRLRRDTTLLVRDGPSERSSGVSTVIADTTWDCSDFVCRVGIANGACSWTLGSL